MSPAHYSDSIGIAGCLLVILARGCRAKNPGLCGPPERYIRDSSRTPDPRAGMTAATMLPQSRCNYLLQSLIVCGRSHNLIQCLIFYNLGRRAGVRLLDFRRLTLTTESTMAMARI